MSKYPELPPGYRFQPTEEDAYKEEEHIDLIDIEKFEKGKTETTWLVAWYEPRTRQARTRNFEQHVESEEDGLALLAMRLYLGMN